MEEVFRKEHNRLAINTIILNVKLAITIIANFIIARLVLKSLGADDFGLYSVVGGITAIMNIFGTSMVATSYRFIAVEFGKNNGNPKKIYNTVLMIHIFLSSILVLTGETVGIYYVNNCLNIDSDKIPDALFVLHMTIVTASFTVLSIPANGVIIAKEKFLFTSVAEIVDTLIKLFLIILLMYYTGNRLRVYSVIMALYSLILMLSYHFYCIKNAYNIVKWKLNTNIADYKEILAFAMWILVGAIATLSRIQGTAIIMNVFFGTVVNAAFALATQVNIAVSSFTQTIGQAANPQIMKSISSGNTERSYNIIFDISRYSFFILLIPGTLLMIYPNELLRLWLDEPPKYTSAFIILMILNGFVSVLGTGFDASIQATGRIRLNQIGYSLIFISILPLSYIFYQLDYPPYTNVMVMIILTLVALLFQIWILVRLIGFPVARYSKKTLKPTITVFILTFLSLVVIRYIYGDINGNISLFLMMCISALLSALFIYQVGLTKEEKTIFLVKISNVLKIR